MSEYLSDQEQADRVVKLIKKHGYNVVMAVLLGLTAYFGYKYWVNKQANESFEASGLLTKATEENKKIQLLAMQNKPVPEGEVTTFLSGVDDITKKYPNTLFSQQAFLQKAQYFVSKNELPKAIEALNSAKSQFSEDKGLLTIIDLRLATVLIADGKADKAIELLNSVNNSAFLVKKQELLGDAYVAQNKSEQAKEAYQKAWDLQEEDSINRILAIKLESLGVIPKKSEKAKTETKVEAKVSEKA